MNPGMRFGRYEVGELLGKGGFGVVHVARDVDLGRDLAIKFLKPEYLTRSQIVQRFLQEARAAAKIGHPGIVTVFDCGLVSGVGRVDGTAYIAMERLQGESLGDRITAGKKFPIANVIAIARQLAAALQAAHAAGIVHRDLKPDNVFLIRDSAVVGGERTKILDFGIAKLAEPGPGGVHTHSQMILGTPRYMSPEQARSSAKADARSDVYALGCMLYELVCGRPPFDGDAGDVMMQHQTEEPARPSDLMDNVPPGLDALIVQMLAKDPADRPSSMQAVDEALERLPTRHSSVALDPVPRQKPKFVARPIITSVVEPPPPVDLVLQPEEETTLPRQQVRLVDEKVRLVDEKLRLVDEKVRLVDEKLRLGDTQVDPTPPPVVRPTPKVASGSIDSRAPPKSDPIEPMRAVIPPQQPRESADNTLEVRGNPRRHLAFGAGVAVAVLLLVVITMCSGGSKEDAKVIDAAPAADAAVVLKKNASTAEDIEWIVSQCETAKTDRNWVALDRCGKALIPLARERGEAYVALALREAKADLAARATPDAAVDDTPDAEIEATDDPRDAGGKPRSGRSPVDTVTIEEDEDDDKPSPASACGDAQLLIDLEIKGDAGMSKGTFATALAAFEQVLRCKPAILQKTYLAACRARAFPRAKQLYRILGKENLAQICMKEGFDPR